MSIYGKNKRLLLMVGLPFSGKSTYAKATGHPIVSPDAIRRAHGYEFYKEMEPMIWGIAHVMVRALFSAGHEWVVLDACNVTNEQRDKWSNENWLTYYKHIPTAVDICKSRARAALSSSMCGIIQSMDGKFESLSRFDQGEYECTFETEQLKVLSAQSAILGNQKEYINT